jgi:hypothetical protein
MREPEADLVARLEADLVLRREGDRLRTARRFQSAMARAAMRLRAEGEDGDDLRVPLAHALLELYPSESDERILALIELLLPIELAELAPQRASPP